jgi:tetratricopeptide (TPR) repeat protein
LRYLFRDINFGSLPSIQTALTKLPQAMDSGKLEELLLDSFTRDMPNLKPEQHKEGARLYTDALLRTVGSLEQFVSPILIQTVLDLKKGQHSLKQGQSIQIEKLDSIIARLELRAQYQVSVSPTLQGDLPFGSYLPLPRNRNFTGRITDMDKLAEALLADDQPGVVINQAITGMGGLGKTQLAVEFAYEYGHKFQGVHWLDLREAQRLDEQISLCGSKMGLPVWPPTLPEQVTATLREWLQNNPRVLILDNFEETEAANEVLARLRHSGLRLLITSRRTDWNNALGLQRLSLDEFSQQESLDFLRNYIPTEREDDGELTKLAEHLGHLPLALELVGRYLKIHSRLMVSEYHTQLENVLDHKSMQNWKVEQKSLTGHDLSLLQTFAQSWEQVQEPNAQKLFIASGYCAPNTPIPVQIHKLALDEEEKDSGEEFLADLVGIGLLKEGYAIHPLLAQFARGLDTDQEVLSQFGAALAKLANQTNHEEDRTGNYSLYNSILPHIRTMAVHGEQAALEASGELWNSLGYHIRALADYAGAKAAYERALKIDEAAFGPDHPDVAIYVNNLGMVLQALGDHAGAKAAYERALKIFEKFLPADHPNIRIVKGNLESL